MKTISLILSILLPVLVSAANSTEGCFHRHLEEAMELNRNREPLYAALSGNQSKEISASLIGVEKSMRFFTQFIYNFDRQEKEYRNKGMQITCEAFIEMSTVAPFRSTFENGPPRDQDFLKIDGKQLKRDLRKTLKDPTLKQTYDLAVKHLEKLEHEPRLNCLARHMLESIARTAALRSKWIRESKQLGLPSPEDLIHKMAKSHLSFLPTLMDLDDLARPLQVQNIPILCQDVPVIPVPEFGL